MAALDSSSVIASLVWVAFIWPPTLVSICLLLGQRRGVRKLAFLVLGIMVCFGVQWLVGQLSTMWRFNSMVAASLDQRLMAVLERNLIAVLLVSIAVSLGPVLWLRRLLSSNSGPGGM